MSYRGRASYNRAPNCASRNTKPYIVMFLYPSAGLLAALWFCFARLFLLAALRLVAISFLFAALRLSFTGFLLAASWLCFAISLLLAALRLCFTSFLLAALWLVAISFLFAALRLCFTGFLLAALYLFFVGVGFFLATVLARYCTEHQQCCWQKQYNLLHNR